MSNQILKFRWVADSVNIMHNSFEGEVKLPFLGMNGPNVVNLPHFKGVVKCHILLQTPDTLVIHYHAVSLYSGGAIRTSKEYTYSLKDGEIVEIGKDIAPLPWMAEVNQVKDLDKLVTA